MKFVMSYSCGKDSTLALHRMVKAGHEAVALLVMYNESQERSWFHGVDDELLNRISESLRIPLLKVVSQGENYHLMLEEALGKAKAMGAEACVFGDIDIEDHKTWCAQRCAAANIGYEFPLWQESREALTSEIISLGYRAVIKCINNKKLPLDFLGSELDYPAVERMKKLNVDVCGENGEYHTVVIDGPMFQNRIQLRHKGIVNLGDYSALDVEVCK